MSLPSNTDAEQSIISSILYGHVQDEVFDIVSASDFYSSRNRIIFGMMSKMYSEKKVIDLVTLSNELKENNRLDDVGGISDIVRLIEESPLAVNPVQYAKIVKAVSSARELCEAAIKIQDEVQNASYETIESIIDEAQAKILAVKFNPFEKPHLPFNELVSNRVDDYERMSKGKPSGVNTGFPTIDRITGGFWGGKLIIIAARPGTGKTAFMLNMAKNMVKRNHTVGVFELEMDKEELVDRMFSSFTQINSIKLAMGDIRSNEEWEKINDAASRMYQYNLNIDDTGGLVITELKRRARNMVKDGAEVIFIDQLSKIRGGKGKSEYEQRSYIVNELMVLKKELKVPIVLLAQINRNASMSKPGLQDLKSTGSLEEDSDIVLLGYRKYMQTKDEADRNKASWEIAKHRGGLTWNIDMLWNEKTTTFSEVYQ